MKRNIRILAVNFIFIFIFCTYNSYSDNVFAQKTIVVGTSTPIQESVDLARNGDTVLVPSRATAYRENLLVLDKKIEIRFEPGAVLLNTEKPLPLIHVFEDAKDAGLILSGATIIDVSPAIDSRIGQATIESPRSPLIIRKSYVQTNKSVASGNDVDIYDSMLIGNPRNKFVSAVVNSDVNRADSPWRGDGWFRRFSVTGNTIVNFHSIGLYYEVVRNDVVRINPDDVIKITRNILINVETKKVFVPKEYKTYNHKYVGFRYSDDWDQPTWDRNNNIIVASDPLGKIKAVMTIIEPEGITKDNIQISWDIESLGEKMPKKLEILMMTLKTKKQQF